MLVLGRRCRSRAGAGGWAQEKNAEVRETCAHTIGMLAGFAKAAVPLVIFFKPLCAHLTDHVSEQHRARGCALYLAYCILYVVCCILRRIRCMLHAVCCNTQYNVLQPSATCCNPVLRVATWFGSLCRTRISNLAARWRLRRCRPAQCRPAHCCTQCAALRRCIAEVRLRTVATMHNLPQHCQSRTAQLGSTFSCFATQNNGLQPLG
jgi:hypothetical protein